MIESLPYVKLTEQFDLEHGGPDKKFVIHKGQLYFIDGARRPNDVLAMHHPPHPDPHTRANAIFFYHEEVCRRAEKKFHQLRGAIEHRLMISEENAFDPRHTSAPPTDAEIEELHQLHIAVKQYQANVEAAQKQVDATVPERNKQSDLAAEATMRRCHKVRSVLDGIKI